MINDLLATLLHANSPAPIPFAIVVPKISQLESPKFSKKIGSNIYKGIESFVFLTDKINSTRQIVDGIIRRIGWGYLEILENQEGKWEDGCTVICDIEKSKALDAQAMSGLNQVLASPLSF